jgi:AcrR family transcriptional regulator
MLPPRDVIAWRMSRKRLTREDSRDQTKQRLLDAAQRIIARKGLSAASVENIAAAAGYTRGAFYSNFKSKDDLFIELLRRDHEANDIELGVLQDDSLSVDHIQARVRELYGQLYRSDESFMVWTEARMLAAREAKFRAKLNALLSEKCAHIAEFIGYFYHRVGLTPPVPPATLAVGFMSLFEGVQLSLLSNQAGVTPATAETVLTVFVDSLMQLARLQAAKQPR